MNAGAASIEYAAAIRRVLADKKAKPKERRHRRGIESAHHYAVNAVFDGEEDGIGRDVHADSL